MHYKKEKNLFELIQAYKIKYTWNYKTIKIIIFYTGFFKNMFSSLFLIFMYHAKIENKYKVMVTMNFGFMCSCKRSI